MIFSLLAFLKFEKACFAVGALEWLKKKYIYLLHSMEKKSSILGFNKDFFYYSPFWNMKKHKLLCRRPRKIILFFRLIWRSISSTVGALECFFEIMYWKMNLLEIKKRMSSTIGAPERFLIYRLSRIWRNKTFTFGAPEWFFSFSTFWNLKKHKFHCRRPRMGLKFFTLENKPSWNQKDNTFHYRRPRKIIL